VKEKGSSGSRSGVVMRQNYGIYRGNACKKKYVSSASLHIVQWQVFRWMMKSGALKLSILAKGPVHYSRQSTVHFSPAPTRIISFF